MPAQNEPAAAETRGSDVHRDRDLQQAMVPRQSTPSNKLPVDRLSMLPPELLTLIFDLATEFEDSSLFAGLSRALLAYQNASLYHEIEFKTRKSLRMFFRTIVRDDAATDGAKQRGKYLGSLVRTIKVSFDQNKEEDDDTSRLEVSKLFGALTSINKLWIQYCAPFLDFLTLTSTATENQLLPSLRKLVLHLHLDDFQSIGGEKAMIGSFTWLSSLRNLEQFSIFATNDDTSGLPLSSKISANLSLTFTEFHLFKFQSGMSSESLATFLHHCPHLRTLMLIDGFDELDYDVVLSKVSTGLRKLSLERGEAQDDDEDALVEFGSILTRFPELEELTLRCIPWSEATVLGIQSCSQLRRIHVAYSFMNYEHTIPVPYLLLKKLLESKKTPPLLEELEIDFAPCQDGEPILDIDQLSRSPEDLGWQLPEWEEGFGMVEGMVLVMLAENGLGIRLTGGLTWALGCQFRWMGFLDDLRKQYGLEDEDDEGSDRDGEEE